ncbi:MAG: hypothetical protein NC408_05690 [Candidatus Gastranaerophilales bacterium]|nr:hypothetical protein [Candidatus Gastranaerophilales bacterium]MCM1073297.1 hypothetical protein [Bacteroides sp.]
MGFNYTNNMWSQPMMTNFNNGFGWNNNFNSFTPSWGTSAWTTSSSTSSTRESAAEYEARIKKEIAQKNEEKRTLLTQRQELQKGLTQVQEQKTALNGTVKEDGSVEVKGAIQQDGTIKEEKLENMSTGAKIMRGVTNAFKGIGNVCKSFVGIDPKTGKWDPLKCVRNVGIAVAVGALCVFAAPLGAAAAAALGGGAIATGVGTAVAAVPTALAYAGLGTGAYMAGKGVYDTAKANNLEEFDQGTQDIGAGAFIGVSSAAGLRGMSKAAGVASASEGTFASSVSAGAKNVFVNPWKAASQNFEWAEAGYALNGLSGARQAVKMGQAGVAKNAFNTQKQQLTAQLEQKIADVEARYNAATSAKDKALIELEYDGLVNQYSQLEANLPTTKAGWRTFDSANKEYTSQLKGYKKAMRPWGKGEVEIHGQKFTSADKEALSAAIKSIRKSQKGIDAQMSALKTARFDSMQALAKSSSSSHQAEAQAFGFENNWYSSPYNWAQSKYYGFTMPKSMFGKAMMLGNGALYVSEPAWALQGVASNSGAMPLNGMYAFNPTREASEGLTTTIPAEQYAQAKTGYETQEQQIKTAIGEIDSKLKSLA